MIKGFIKGFTLTVGFIIAVIAGIIGYGYSAAFLLSYTDLSLPVKMLISLIGLAGIIGGIAYAADERAKK